MAKAAHIKVEERLRKLTDWADTDAFELGINKKIMFDRKIGVIAAGSCYVYAREALGEKASYLKLGIVNPLPVQAIKEFAGEVETLYVIEELDDIIETHCIKLGLKVIGKEKFGFLGEFSQSIIQKAILGTEKESVSLDITIPPRPPVLCAGCRTGDCLCAQEV
jgi:indolepyruvate ferredoxin oxidoreductase alpha subunit